MIEALENVMAELKGLHPAGLYGYAYGIFKGHAEDAVERLQTADFMDDPTWMNLGHQLHALSELCAEGSFFYNKMPGLFGCLNEAIVASLNAGWEAVHPVDRRHHLLELMHAIGDGFVALGKEEIVPRLGSGGYDVMLRIGQHLQGAR